MNQKGATGRNRSAISASPPCDSPTGNTLLTTGNGQTVLEVTPDRQIVWQLHQNGLPDITLAWVTTLEVLPTGNYVIGNCHTGSGTRR